MMDGEKEMVWNGLIVRDLMKWTHVLDDVAAAEVAFEHSLDGVWEIRVIVLSLMTQETQIPVFKKRKEMQR